MSDVSGDLALAFGDELLQEQARDHVERFKDAFTFVRAGDERRDLFLAVVEQVLHELDRADRWQLHLLCLAEDRLVRALEHHLEGVPDRPGQDLLAQRPERRPPQRRAESASSAPIEEHSVLLSRHWFYP